MLKILLRLCRESVKLLQAIVLVIFTIVLSVVGALPFYIGSQTTAPLSIRLLLMIGAFIAVLFGLLLLRRLITRQESMKKKQLRFRFVATWTVVIFIVEILINILLWKLGFDLESGSGNNQDILKQFQSSNFWIILLSTSLVAPILEEVLFRGIMLEWLLQEFPKASYFTIAFTSFIFAYCHTFTLTANLIGYFISGTLMGYLYYLSRNVKDAVLAHSLSNLLVSLVYLGVYLMN